MLGLEYQSCFGEIGGRLNRYFICECSPLLSFIYYVTYTDRTTPSQLEQPNALTEISYTKKALSLQNVKMQSKLKCQNESINETISRKF